MEVMNLWREKLCPSISHWFSSLKSINKGGLFSHSFLVSNCYFWVNKNIQRLAKWSLFPMSYHSTLLMLKPVRNLNFNSSIIVFITNKLHGALLLKLLESPLSTNTRNEWTMCRASLMSYSRKPRYMILSLPLLSSYAYHASINRAFCECWCPATNTLHTSIGEISISLWDMNHIIGLPIHGMFYNEVVSKSCVTIKENFHFHQVLLFLFGLHQHFSQTKGKLVKMTS